MNSPHFSKKMLKITLVVDENESEKADFRFSNTLPSSTIVTDLSFLDTLTEASLYRSIESNDESNFSPQYLGCHLCCWDVHVTYVLN